MNDEDPLNYYSILNVSPDAEAEEIKASYHNLSKLYHPDKHNQESKKEAHDRLSRINKAYEVISDSNKRKAYHARALISQSQNIDMYELMENIPDEQIFDLFSSNVSKSFVVLHADIPYIHSSFRSHKFMESFSIFRSLAAGAHITFPSDFPLKSRLKFLTTMDMYSGESSSNLTVVFHHNLFLLSNLKHSIKVSKDLTIYKVKHDINDEMSFSVALPAHIILFKEENFMDLLDCSFKCKLSKSTSYYIGLNFLFSQGLSLGFNHKLAQNLSLGFHLTVSSISNRDISANITINHFLSSTFSYNVTVFYDWLHGLSFKFVFSRHPHQLHVLFGPNFGLVFFLNYKIGNFDFSLPIRVFHGFSNKYYLSSTLASFLVYNLWHYLTGPNSYKILLYRIFWNMFGSKESNIDRMAAEKYQKFVEANSLKVASKEKAKNGLVITNALCRFCDSDYSGGETINVTLALQSLVIDSKVKLPAIDRSLLLGYDTPFSLPAKVLEIDYTFGGYFHHVTVNPNKPVILPSRSHIKFSL